VPNEGNLKSIVEVRFVSCNIIMPEAALGIHSFGHASGIWENAVERSRICNFRRLFWKGAVSIDINVGVTVRGARPAAVAFARVVNVAEDAIRVILEALEAVGGVVVVPSCPKQGETEL